MMKFAAAAAVTLALASGSSAYELKDLSARDLLTLGAGLDELPRRVGDADNLWGRLQKQIADQDLAHAAAAEAAEEARIRKKIEAEKAAQNGEPAK